MFRAHIIAAVAATPSKRTLVLHALAAALLAPLLILAMPQQAAAQANPFEIVSPTPNQNIVSRPIVLTLKRSPELQPSVEQVRQGQGPWIDLKSYGFLIDDDVVHVRLHHSQFSPAGQYSIRTKAKEPAYANAPWNEVTFFVLIDPSVSPLRIVQPSSSVYPGPPVHLVVDTIPNMWVAPTNSRVTVKLGQSHQPYATIIKNDFTASDYPFQMPLLTDPPSEGVKVRVFVEAHNGPGPITSNTNWTAFFPPAEWEFWYGPPQQGLASADDVPVDPQLGVVKRGAQRQAKDGAGERKVTAKVKEIRVIAGANVLNPSGNGGGQTAAVPTTGQYGGRFAVVSDPCKLEGKIGLARGGQTLTAATRGASLDISGGPPFVKVSGSAASNPAALSGNGTAAGQSANVSASASFGGGGLNSLTMDYVMTLPGRCTGTTTNAAGAAAGGANAVTYKFTGQKR